MDPIIAYLKNSELPEEKTKAHILRLKASHSVLYDDKLYRRGYLMPLWKYVLPTEEKIIMWEIHEGIDLIGRLPKGRGSVQYVVVTVDYFTKWVQVVALVSVTPAKIKEFIYKNIVC